LANPAIPELSWIGAQEYHKYPQLWIAVCQRGKFSVPHN